MNWKHITQYFYEIFQLKRIKHNGWYRANVPHPDSVAEHVLLASQIGYILAHLEKANADTVLKMLVFHDNPEARVGDMDKVVCRYISDKVSVEKKGLADQVQNLPPHLGKELQDLFAEMEDGETPEAIIVKDADYLEQAFQARIYQSQGYEGVSNWLDNIKKHIRTPSAKELFSSLLETDPNAWFVGLKHFKDETL